MWPPVLGIASPARRSHQTRAGSVRCVAGFRPRCPATLPLGQGLQRTGSEREYAIPSATLVPRPIAGALAINMRANSQRLLGGQDQINVESGLGLLWIDLCDQSTVPWRGNPHVYVWRPPRIATWKVRGVLVATSGARMLRCPVRVVIVTARVSGPPFDHSFTQRAAIPC
jgi:hypothetical protein